MAISGPGNKDEGHVTGTKLHLGKLRGDSLDGIDHTLHILSAIQNERLLWRPLGRQRCCQHLLHSHEPVLRMHENYLPAQLCQTVRTGSRP